MVKNKVFDKLCYFYVKHNISFKYKLFIENIFSKN